MGKKWSYIDTSGEDRSFTFEPGMAHQKPRQLRTCITRYTHNRCLYRCAHISSIFRILA